MKHPGCAVLVFMVLVSASVPAITLAEPVANRAQSQRGGGTVRTVGPDAACQFSSVQAAITAASDGDTIRVMTGIYNESLSILSKDLQLIGGFADCTSTTASGRSTLDQQGAGLGVDIFYPAAVGDPLREVVLQNWRIRNGGGTGDFVGGILVEGRPGRLAVELNNVEIRDNIKTGISDNGAGLRVQVSGDAADTGGLPFGPLVQIDNDSAIISNSTGGQGGGIYCQSSFDVGFRGVLRLGSVLVFDNEADDGGGLAVNGCKNVRMFSGGPFVLIVPTGGIIGNTATGNGGGVYVDNGGEVFIEGRALSQIGDPDEAGLISGNQASSGGAAAISGDGSLLQLRDTYVTGNTADVFGGAFRVINDGRLEIGRQPGSGVCREAEVGGGVLSRPPCMIIEDNVAGNRGGVFSLTGTAIAVVESTIIRNNDAPSGSIATVSNLTIDTGPPSRLTMRSVLLDSNTGGTKLEAQSSGEIELRYATVVDHLGGFARASAVADRSASIEVSGTIFDGNSSLFSSLGDGTTSITGRCIISDIELASSGFDSADFYSVIDPQFIDRANADFHLSAQSPALDYCDNSGAPLRDLDQITRGAVWNGPPRPVAPNAVPGDFDLGAYAGQFEPLNADLAMATDPPGQQRLFINNGDSIAISMTLTNNGPNTAFGPIDVIDDFSAGAVSNESWSCTPPAGVTCAPAAGTGDIQTEISGLQPGQQVAFSRSADLAQPGIDQSFAYVILVTESQFNLDSNNSNNSLELDLETGLFADGFE